MAHLHVLVVDDSSAMRKQLCYALRRVVGMDTVEAADGADAWRKLTTAAFDLVITDINMPLLDGLKLVALVVITTEGAEADRKRAMSLGASAYLVKPVQANQVVDTVRSLLRLS
jgi:two-component system chemotaxis response regulator CheY